MSARFDNEFNGEIVKTQWEGLTEYIRDLKTIDTNSPKVQKEFLLLVEQVVLDVIKRNSPVDTGELAASWKVTARGRDYIELDTDQPEKFFAVVNGQAPHVIRAKNANVLHYFVGGQEFFNVEVNHPGTTPNNFMRPILRALDEMMNNIMSALIAKYYKVFSHTDRRGKLGINNITRTVGLTGTRISRRRGRGSGIQKVRTGRRQFKRVLGRRRRTGKFIKKQDVKVG
jgi:hypothetical protein